MAKNSPELPRRAPALIAYLAPFRTVAADGFASWDCSIDQVNGRSWDYVALHEIVGGIDVGLPAPYHMFVCRDGALALPPLPEFRSDQAAIGFFNKCLSALLLGGIYCEAVSADGLDLGSVIDWKYVRSIQRGQASANRFHLHVRQMQAAALEAVALYKPRLVTLDELRAAMVAGMEIQALMPSVAGEFLLKGVTSLARRDWGSALANLWIVTEQILSGLWDAHVLEPLKGADRARRDQLSDTRTWTASARIELLHHKGVIPDSALAPLSFARRARNELAHGGKQPDKPEADAAFKGVQALMQIALAGRVAPLFALPLDAHALSDPFSIGGRLKGEPEFWMAIPKLPGEEELEKEEAQRRKEQRNETKSKRKKPPQTPRQSS